MTARQGDEPRAAVNERLRQWRQGDCVLSEQWFAHRFDPALPLRDESAALQGEDVDLAESDAPGFVVLTQTCDVVRACEERPFVEVAPLIEVTEGEARQIERGLRPAYATVPTLRARRLVADLDRTMTVEKPVVAGWERQEGCTTDRERRVFARALSRKRARYAFPDDFNALTAKLQKRIRRKHETQGDQGRALRALLEIRVRAAPSWDADEVELMFWFVRDESEPAFEKETWETLIETWLALVLPGDRYGQVFGQATALEDMTARDYVESDPLDLDHMTGEEEDDD